MAYTPLQRSYGELPESSEDGSNTIICKVKDAGVPDDAKEVLVFLFATTKGAEEFHRLFYQVETTDGLNHILNWWTLLQAKTFLWTLQTYGYHYFQESVCNRMLTVFIFRHNCNWIAHADDFHRIFYTLGEVTVTLVDAEPHKGSLKSIAHRDVEGPNGATTFSQFFVIGYRWKSSWNVIQFCYSLTFLYFTWCSTFRFSSEAFNKSK